MFYFVSVLVILPMLLGHYLVLDQNQILWYHSILTYSILLTIPVTSKSDIYSWIEEEDLVDTGSSASTSMNQDQIILAKSPFSYLQTSAASSPGKDPTAPAEPTPACRQLHTQVHTLL